MCCNQKGPRLWGCWADGATQNNRCQKWSTSCNDLYTYIKISCRLVLSDAENDVSDAAPMNITFKMSDGANLLKENYQSSAGIRGKAEGTQHHTTRCVASLLASTSASKKASRIGFFLSLQAASDFLQLFGRLVQPETHVHLLFEGPRAIRLQSVQRIVSL